MPYFKRSEHADGLPNDGVYGTGGPLNVSPIPDVLGYTELFIAAGEEMGLPRRENFNGPVQEGLGAYHYNHRDGRRHSAADAYLKPILHRGNLSISTYAHVTRILFEGNRAVGVEYVHDHQLKQDRAEAEIILSGGAINSPQILLCSGIGPATRLREFGIPVIADLPGVGENFQDHPLLKLSFRSRSIARPDVSLTGPAYQQYLKDRTGTLVSTRTFAGGFWKTQPDLPAADLQLFFEIGAADDEYDFSIGLSLMRPASRGYLRLRSANPFDHPIIAPNYLARDEDLLVFIPGIRMARRFAKTGALAGILDAELAPGPAAGSDAQIAAWVREALATTWH